ncbi:MAG: hypothetical protein K9K67_01115 [Bacteriovoracaceae bacterium]|nr:hypothetical protein [Bacteriovoracaceae bacterium]
MLLTFAVRAEESAHSTPFTPEEEAIYFSDTYKLLDEGVHSNKKRKFPYRYWDECLDRGIRGNYVDHFCNSKRMISNILYHFISNNLYSCIERAAGKAGFRIQDAYVIHKGIFADSLHSPQSLHSEGRAIDIAAVRIKTFWKGWGEINFQRSGGGVFYEELRSCWGETLYYNNECPLFKGQPEMTGSLGKEDPDHQRHLHLSVPYCINGQHAGPYFRR